MDGILKKNAKGVVMEIFSLVFFLLTFSLAVSGLVRETLYTTVNLWYFKQGQGMEVMGLG